MKETNEKTENGVGYVYILTNPCFKENWVKIGFTISIPQRIKELSHSTGVPLPFEEYAKIKTTKYKAAEKLIHKMIGTLAPDIRINPKKEFFELMPEEAVEILKIVAPAVDGEFSYSEKILQQRASEQKTSNPQTDRLNSSAFDCITKDHILQAVAFIEKNKKNIPSKYESKTRNVIVNGKKYAPKLVIAVAFLYADGIQDREILAEIEKQKLKFNTLATFPIYSKLEFEIENKGGGDE